MKKSWMITAALLAICLTATGCFEMETEVKLLPDGSGFVSVWVKMTERLATIGAAAQGSTLAREKRSALARLDRLFYERDGIQLVERVIEPQGDSLVLRYRYAFDSPEKLNAFWAHPENREQELTIQGGKLTFVPLGEGCGARYEAAVALDRAPMNQVFQLADDIVGQASPEAREAVVEEYLKGRFRLRVVLPGKPGATDATMTDTTGRPMWETTLLALYRRGLTAKANSQITCEDTAPRPTAADETPPAPTITLSAGPRPTVTDVMTVLGNLGDLVTLEIDATVAKKSTLELRYAIDSRVAPQIEALLLMVIGTLPTLAEDWSWSAARGEQGRLIVAIKTKEALRLDKTGSPTLFAGRDGPDTVFRLRLPALTAGAGRPPEVIGPVVIRASVKMPKDVRQSNATEIEGDTARWVLTARDLAGPVVLEAISEN
jgi:hypothetical protein